jgi:MoaA/NifB/PqqE/SkfB family radical SAM enzyme
MALEMTAQELTILYRGELSSCNYTCNYCPFTKNQDDRVILARDTNQLTRFVKWVSACSHPVSVFFTPRGEALIHRHYQVAVKQIGGLARIRRIAIQTNLSLSMRKIEKCASNKLALWCSYHPAQVLRRTFVNKCISLLNIGIPFSVGVVGNRSDLNEIRLLRKKLPEQIYLWINANRNEQADYSPQELAEFRSIDPLFDYNLPIYPSKGQRCYSGNKVISVDGHGNVQRCHFVTTSLGNLYDGSFQPTSAYCPNTTCDCHIGYVHMPKLRLYEIFKEGLLERRPAFGQGTHATNG